MAEPVPLSTTASLCPVCLRRVRAVREQEGDTVFLSKQCPEHGPFRTVLWRGDPAFSSWIRPKTPSTPQTTSTTVDKGCPFDCGLCPDHGQHTCTALIELTRRCNLRCPICFAESETSDAGNKGKNDEPDLERIGWLYDRVMTASGPCNIQLSGGEPTLREDLEAIIALGRSKGFSFLQLNTNGLRLAEHPGYARALKAAGLSSVFLQFDGLSPAVHRQIRGRDLHDTKQRAIEHCAAAGLGIVLVPVLVPGINTGEVWSIIEYALQFAPAVRGVHFQPLSYFGRYPRPPSDQDRLTLPELLQLLFVQSGGRLQPEQFAPPACEHALCSLHGSFLIEEDGRLTALGQGAACCSSGEPGGAVPTALEGRERSVRFTARQWAHPLPMAQLPEQNGAGCGCAPTRMDDLDRFLQRARTHTFSISAMAFQDVWNLDLERLRGCCIHVVAPDGKLIPFCAYNLTSATGVPLYRGNRS
ncbi:MAG: radical SAM (seleno)protein TrsS [Desulfobulbus sp.]|jgi:uncharacterized radical SAM superfamily Fe-S cluster-containing enzyme